MRRVGGLPPSKNQHHTPARQTGADSSMNAIVKTQNSPRPLLPRLRFAEFRGEWITVELGRFSQLVTERVGVTACVPYTIAAGIGLISQEEKLGRIIAGSSLKNYIVLQRNDFAYNKSATKAYPEGFIALYAGDERAAVPNSIFTCFRVNQSQVNPSFLSELFQNNLHGKWLKTRVAVGARAHGSLQVSNDDLMAIPVPLPSDSSSLAEQQKIAACLSSLDTLITAEAQKLDTLKTHKKGLMQQLFPRAGETTPRLRFAEFRGEWKMKAIGEILDLLSGFPFKGKEIKEDATGVPLMRGINITEGYIRHDKEIDRFFTGSFVELEKYRLRENDLVIGMDGSKVGKNSALVSEADAGALLIQRVARLRADCETNIRFVFLHINSNIFHSYVDRINTSGGIPHISLKQISDFKIFFPGIKEQQKIAACLSSLDELITAQAQKVAALQSHKKGLMQQLFPAQSEASV